MDEGQQDNQQERQQADAVGIFVRQKFDEAARDKRSREDEWLKDLRQYRGKYEPEVEQLIGDNRSKAFYRATRVKVRTMDARMASILFPGGQNKNWGIDPTPYPEVAPEMLEAAVGAYVEAIGQQPSQADIEALTKQLAENACERTEVLIDDYFDEGKYSQKARRVLHSGHMYGTGVLKGPMVDQKVRRGWGMDKDAGAFAATETMQMEPWFDWVSVWDLFPDPNATEIDDCEYVIQRHRMTKSQVRKLKDKGFDGKKINEYLNSHRNGDFTMSSIDVERRAVSDGMDSVPHQNNRYELLEYWGTMDGQDLAQCGCDVPEDKMDQEHDVSVWVMGNCAIKVAMNPFERKTIPYHMYRPETDETSIWGISIPSNIRDSQEVTNAAWRITIDNAAVALGPVGEVNLDLLEPGEDPRSIHAMRMFQRRGTGQAAQYPAVRFHNVPSYTRELLGLVDRAKQMMDEESTVPSYMHGDADRGGAGNTASGLSMLMGASNITIGDAAYQFDVGVTKPFISAMYDWIMQFGDDHTLRGDYEVSAKGSTTLMAKEMRTQQLMMMTNLAANPAFAPYFDHYELMDRLQKETDLSGVILDKNEIGQHGMGAGVPGGAGPVPQPQGQPGDPGSNPGIGG